MKSGNLNSLEPSGPLQACNGTDLPLPLKKIILNSVAFSPRANYTDRAAAAGRRS